MAWILIVEDEELINNLIKENLVLAGHSCTQIYDGVKAKERIQEQNFNLILLDLMLPGCSGYDVLEKCNDIPVIILTARDDVQDKVKGLNRGAEDYIVKPFDMLELIARVNVVPRRPEMDWTDDSEIGSRLDVRGVDSPGFVQAVFRYYNIELPRSCKEQEKTGEDIQIKDAKAGDIIFYGADANEVTHCGICLGDGRVVHSSSKAGKVIISDMNYRKIISVRRVVGTSLTNNAEIIDLPD